MAKWLPNGRASATASHGAESSVQFYTKNKDGQYELWDPDRKPGVRVWLIPSLVVILVIGAIFLIR